jgi:hypothetical protein
VQSIYEHSLWTGLDRVVFFRLGIRAWTHRRVAKFEWQRACEGKVVGRELVVAGRDAPALQSGPQSPHPMRVAMLVACPRQAQGATTLKEDLTALRGLRSRESLQRSAEATNSRAVQWSREATTGGTGARTRAPDVWSCDRSARRLTHPGPRPMY